MHKSKQKSSSHGSAGVALLELLIVAPLLLMLSLGALEVGRLINAQQSLNMLIRESGDLIFRQCRKITPDSQIGQCISDALSANIRLQEFGPLDSEIIISLYEYSNAVDLSAEEPVTLEFITLKGRGSFSSAPQNQSRHSPSTLDAQLGIFRKHPRVVIAEGFVQFKFLSGFTRHLLGGDRQLYGTFFF